MTFERSIYNVKGHIGSCPHDSRTKCPFQSWRQVTCGKRDFEEKSVGGCSAYDDIDLDLTDLVNFFHLKLLIG